MKNERIGSESNVLKAAHLALIALAVTSACSPSSIARHEPTLSFAESAVHGSQISRSSNIPAPPEYWSFQASREYISVLSQFSNSRLRDEARRRDAEPEAAYVHFVLAQRLAEEPCNSSEWRRWLERAISAELVTRNRVVESDANGAVVRRHRIRTIRGLPEAHHFLQQVFSRVERCPA